ncbi:MAG: hypothetical protein ABL995_06370 [Bryobacteraceae bacterium]
MIDLQEAVFIAKQEATKILGPNQFSLEELERDVYKSRDVWSITLGLPKPALFLNQELNYKRFLIDVETGELLAIKIREVALP